ncbi:MAG: N-acetylmuramoyl-L-alanine amidase [Erysipelotrichaceae bacterium]
MKRRKYNYRNLTILIILFILALLLLFALLFGIYSLVVKANSNSDEASSSSTLPSNVNANKTIVLDAGHGGYDGGSASCDGSVNEKDITLAITLKTGKLLEDMGYKVVYTRTSDVVSWSNDEVQDLSARVRIGEEANADVFVSIHTNASEVNDDGSNGSEVWVMPTSDINLSLATHINNELASLKYTSNRGVKDQAESPIQILLWNQVPAVLVETGFINNSNDFAYMSSITGQDKIAKAIASGIDSTLK